MGSGPHKTFLLANNNLKRPGSRLKISSHTLYCWGSDHSAGFLDAFALGKCAAHDGCRQSLLQAPLKPRSRIRLTTNTKQFWLMPITSYLPGLSPVSHCSTAVLTLLAVFKTHFSRKEGKPEIIQ